MIRNSENIANSIEKTQDLSDQITDSIRHALDSPDKRIDGLGEALAAIEARLLRLKSEFEAVIGNPRVF